MTTTQLPPFERGEMKRAVSKWAIDCGRRLQALREDRGFSRALLASFAGIAEPTLTRIENGTINARDDLRWIISGVLMVDVADVWPNPTRAEIMAVKTPNLAA
jgi:transcriptional regulator with XRE-family HTH domain